MVDEGSQSTLEEWTQHWFQWGGQSGTVYKVMLESKSNRNEPMESVQG